MLFLPERIKISGKKPQQFSSLRRWSEESELLSVSSQPAEWSEEAAVDCLLMLHSSTAPQLQCVPWAQSPHHANCLMPGPPPPNCGGNICTGGNHCKSLLLTKRPRRDEEIWYVSCRYRVITAWPNTMITLIGSLTEGKSYHNKKMCCYIGESSEVSLYLLWCNGQLFR